MTIRISCQLVTSFQFFALLRTPVFCLSVSLSVRCWAARLVGTTSCLVALRVCMLDRLVQGRAFRSCRGLCGFYFDSCVLLSALSLLCPAHFRPNFPALRVWAVSCVGMTPCLVCRTDSNIALSRGAGPCIVFTQDLEIAVAIYIIICLDEVRRLLYHDPTPCVLPLSCRFLFGQVTKLYTFR